MRYVFCKRCGKLDLHGDDDLMRCKVCGYKQSLYPFSVEAVLNTPEEDVDRYIYNHMIHDDMTRNYIKMKEEYDNKLIKDFQDWQAANKPKPANIPHCPICGSADLKKLSTVGKAAKIGIFGIFGMGDVGKTYKCNNCGSKF